jgi:hypothetical protein
LAIFRANATVEQSMGNYAAAQYGAATVLAAGAANTVADITTGDRLGLDRVQGGSAPGRHHL